MDNGEREKAVANGIKEIVKHTSRRKITTQLSSRQQVHVIRIAPNPSNAPLGSSSGAISNRQHDTPPPSDHGSSQEGGIQEVQDASNVSIFTKSNFNQF